MIDILLPALLPAATDGVRSLINKFTGGAGAAPSNPDEAIKLMQADTERLKALAEIEGEGSTYQWVEAVRKLQRPVLGSVAVIGYMTAVHSDVDASTLDSLGQWVKAYFFYLFGERSYQYLVRGAK